MTYYHDQPGVAAVLKMLKAKRGATIAEMAKARGTEQHTIRSIMSRLRSNSGFKIKSMAHAKRGNVYRAK